MSKKLKLEYSFKQNVYETFLDLKKFGELHPAMVKVNVVSTPAPNCIEYEIFEEITLFGFLKLKPYYKAKVVEVEKGKHIQYLSQVKKSVFLKIDFTFTENGSNTKVIEEVEITGNPIVAGVLRDAIKKMHKMIFEKLNPVS